MAHNKHKFLMVLTVAFIGLLMASPAAAGTTLGAELSTNTLEDGFVIEYATVTPGLDLATYAQVFQFGGHDGAGLPVVTDSEGLSQASAWLFTYSSQDGFETYLNRLPMEAAEGASLQIVYPQGMGSTLLKAATAASYFEDLYGISLYLMNFDAGADQADYYAFYAEEDIFTAVADHVTGIDTDGFGGLLDTATITGSPVSWAAYGVRSFDDYKIGMHGAGWVNPSGLTLAGDVYTLSSDNIFGADVEASATPTDGWSRLRYNFPYPISPVEDGISPETSNPMPHVTGKLLWDLKHPVPGYALSSADDFTVSYKIGMANTFPNVQNEMVINQTALNEDGELIVDFNLENIGAETAYDINLAMPLGPDFGELIDKNITIYTMKPEYELDEATTTTYNLVVEENIPGVDIPESMIFNLTGWYVDTGTTDKVFWNSTTTKVIKEVTITILSVDYNVKVSIDGDGFPTHFLDAIDDFIIPNIPTSVSSAQDLVDAVYDNLDEALEYTYDTAVADLYNEEEILIFDEGDFNVYSEEVGISPSESEVRYFLNKTIASLAPGAKETVSFYMHNVPRESQRVAYMDFSLTVDGLDSEGSLVSTEQNYKEIMQYAFEQFNFDGRVISFALPEDFSFGLDTVYPGVYGSLGLIFSYKNEAKYPFFGISNGQNIQFADDEAVISATVELDEQNYNVGAPVEVKVDLSNNGDTDATGMVVHLFHASLGRDWQLERVDKFAEIPVGTLAKNDTTTVYWNGEANTYLGYHTVFAMVEFTSDEGQGPATFPDFLNLGHTEWAAAGEVDHFVMSTLSGALVLPAVQAAEPSIPEPRVSIVTEVIGEDVKTDLALSAGEEFTYKITVTNDGDAPTNVTVSQAYNYEEVEYLGATVSAGTKVETDGQLTVEGIPLEKGASATIEIKFKLKANGTVLPPTFAAFTVSGDSSLGGSVDTGTDVAVQAVGSLYLSAGEAAEEDSQKSGSEDSTSSSFSGASSVGASLDPGNVAESSVVTNAGFIGYSPVEVIAIMAVPMAVFSILRKRRN